MVNYDPPRLRGRRTRALILEQAAALFARRPFDAVSVAEIAEAARAHPSQITYYFRSKEALFVQAAFLLLLRDAERLELIGLEQRTPTAFSVTLSRTAVSLPSLSMVIRAMSIALDKPDLQAVVEHNLSLLFRQAEKYLSNILVERGWAIHRSPARETRIFWSAVLGARLIGPAGSGHRPGSNELAGVLSIHDRP